MDLAERHARGERGVAGVMLESFLVSDRQELGTGRGSLVYGQSVTDACIDWETTEELLERFATAVARRRASVDVDREAAQRIERLEPLEEREVEDGLGRGVEPAAH